MEFQGRLKHVRANGEKEDVGGLESQGHGCCRASSFCYAIGPRTLHIKNHLLELISVIHYRAVLILHPFSNFFELISPAGYIAATLQ